MAYNKTKHLDAAHKNVSQGKVSLAIEDYKAILKHEPRDQATLMSIGDLFVRQGETFQAIEYFERLAQIFLNEGFVAKAIAIYKKIAKLAPEQTRPIERLAELYVQQGVMSEARPIYLHLAEQHQRAGRTAQAAALLRKLLEAEPDSPRVQTKLAELCLALGQNVEAAEAYRTAAQHLHRRGDHAEAIQYAERALQNDPSDVASSVLRARAMIGIGQRPEAIALLNSMPQTASGGEAADLLLDLYIEDGTYDRASELAQKILANHPKRFAAAHRVAEALIEAGEAEAALPLLDLAREPMTHAGEHESLSQSLQQAASQLPGRVEPRQWLVDLHQQTSDSFRLPDALADLAAALELAGEYDHARHVHQQILEREPENEGARRNYEAALGRMGPGSATPEDVEPLAKPQKAPTPPPAEPPLDPTTQQFVNQSLIDVDLFSSYGLTQKAIDLLEVVLERAPRHVPSMERLLDFYLGAGNEQRTAELAAQLQEILVQRGDVAAAERFEQLGRRFGRTPALHVEDVAVKAASPEPSPLPKMPQEAPAPVAPTPASVPEPAAVREPVAASAESGLTAALACDLEAELTVHEVDLSDEWAALAGELKSATPTDFRGDSSRVDEIITAQSSESIDQAPWNAAEIPAIENAATETADSTATSGESDSADLPVYTLDFEIDSDTADSPSSTPIGANAFADAAEPLIADFKVEPTTELGADFGSTSKPGSRNPEPVAAAPSAALAGEGDFLQSLSEELNAALPVLKESQQFKESSRKPASQVRDEAPSDTSAPGPLTDLFDEFRVELDTLAEDEDPETHYNLGIAYREMGLLEEAISEFQKVAKAGNGFEAFRYAMQCCTLLGLSFMEKGQPLIAAMWYERALTIPGLDQETILALRYDLGVAQELAGETAAARKSFSQVYGMNIDYRDVAERLASLGKGN